MNITPVREEDDDDEHRPALLPNKQSHSAGCTRGTGSAQCGRNPREAPGPEVQPPSRPHWESSTAPSSSSSSAPSTALPWPGRTELVDAAQVPDERPAVPQQHQVLLCGK